MLYLNKIFPLQEDTVRDQCLDGSFFKLSIDAWSEAHQFRYFPVGDAAILPIYSNVF